MTISVAAWERSSGRLGAVIASSSISVAARCLHWRAGVGIALSQNVTDPRLGPRLLALLADGVAVDDAMAAVRRNAAYRFRQLALIDSQRHTAPFHRRRRALGRFAEAAGGNCVAAGNLLADESVPAAMVESFETTDGSLGTRLLARCSPPVSRPAARPARCIRPAC